MNNGGQERSVRVYGNYELHYSTFGVVPRIVFFDKVVCMS